MLDATAVAGELGELDPQIAARREGDAHAKPGFEPRLEARRERKLHPHGALAAFEPVLDRERAVIEREGAHVGRPAASPAATRGLEPPWRLAAPQRDLRPSADPVRAPELGLARTSDLERGVSLAGAAPVATPPASQAPVQSTGRASLRTA